MDIMKWEPRRWLFNDLTDTLFSDFMVPKDGRDSSWFPKIELAEENDSYVVKAELAGIDKKDISIDLKDGILTVSAEKKQEKEEKKKTYTYSEFKYGSFQRSIAVPKSLKAEDVRASFDKGILVITLPKVKEIEHPASKIEIK